MSDFLRLEIERLEKGFVLRKNVGPMGDSVTALTHSEVRAVIDIWLGWWLDRRNELDPDKESA